MTSGWTALQKMSGPKTLYGLCGTIIQERWAPLQEAVGAELYKGHSQDCPGWSTG